jgi:NADH-quinone oxidoreductase subunit I
MFGQGLLKGLAITFGRLRKPADTQLYPFEQPVLPENSRMFLAMHHDEDGVPLCKACMTCQTGCPDHVIGIDRDPENPKTPLRFTVNSGRCTFCGICVELCPYSALHFTGDFERATFDRADLIYTLVESGRATCQGEGERHGR